MGSGGPPLPGAARISAHTGRDQLNMLDSWMAGTEPRPPDFESAMSRRTGETEARIPEQRNSSPASIPPRSHLPPRAALWEPRHRGTCFSPYSQGGLRQVIPPRASVISCPNKVASAQPGPGTWSRASLRPTSPHISLWRSLSTEATTAQPHVSSRLWTPRTMHKPDFSILIFLKRKYYQDLRFCGI